MSELTLKSGETLCRLPYGEDKPEATYSLSQVRQMPRALVDWNNDLFRVSELHAAGFTGKGVKVGVGDTGVQKDHPAFNGRLVWAKDYTGSPYGSDDRNGHGTHCCGIIGAGIDAVTGRGAAPDCTMGMAKVLGDGGSGGSFGIAQGVRDMVDAGFDIISLSLGSSSPDSTITAAVDYAVGKGVLVFAAAGNDGPGMNTVGWPGAHPNCIAVAAVDRNGGIAGFSSRGPQVDVAGYGVQVVSSLPGSGAGRMSGTSMACPAVAGLAACLLQRQRDLGRPTDVATMRALVEKSVKPASPATSFGKGIFVPALALDGTPPPPPPVPPITPPPVNPPKKPLVLVGKMEGMFGGKIVLTEQVAGQGFEAAGEDPEAAGRLRDLYELYKFIRSIMDLFQQGDQWAGFALEAENKSTLDVIRAAGVNLDDIRKWLPVVIKNIQVLTPIILDGIAAGKKPLAIFLECIAALSLSGFTV